MLEDEVKSECCPGPCPTISFLDFPSEDCEGSVVVLDVVVVEDGDAYCAYGDDAAIGLAVDLGGYECLYDWAVAADTGVVDVVAAFVEGSSKLVHD